MGRASTKPQCSASVDGTDIDEKPGTFFCVLREGHRGAHRYHENMAEQTGPVMHTHAAMARRASGIP